MEPTKLSLNDVTKKPWRLELDAERMRLSQTESGESFEVPHKDAYAKVALHSSPLGGAMMSVRGESSRKVAFSLGDDVLRTVAGWLGHERTAALILKPFSWILILVGIVWLASSLPVAPMPDDDLLGKPFDIFAFGLGALSVALGVAARIRPRRILLVCDAIWCGAIAADNLRQVAASDSSLGWSIALVVVSIFLVGLGLGQVRFYRALEPHAASAKQP